MKDSRTAGQQDFLFISGGGGSACRRHEQAEAA
jgi:hypothetical protein